MLMMRLFVPLLIGCLGLVLAVAGLAWFFVGKPTTLVSSEARQNVNGDVSLTETGVNASPVQPASEKPFHPATVPADAWFTTIANDIAGIDFRHQTGTNEEKPFPAANGSGIAVLDYDLDGLDDLYFATGTPFPIDSTRSSPINRCYRNSGQFRFQDVTVSCGLGHNGYSAGLAVGDYDNDGFPDLYVNCFGSNVLYHNQGDGMFERVTEAAQVGDPRWGTSAAFLDYDADGSLDLYVCNYAKWSWETRRWCGNRARQVRIYCSPHSVEPEQDALYHSLGDGRFQDEAVSTGIAQRTGRAQGVVAADLNADGKIDLYVGNDLNANSVFLNQGQGRFEDATEISCAGYDYKGSMQAGMGVDAADVTGDGLAELFVTNFQNEHNTLYLNMADGLFQDSSQQFGVYAAGLPWVGWGTAFADFDLDGRSDLVVTNGHVDDNLHRLGENSPYAQPALLWRYEAGKFRELGAQAGAYFTTPHVGRALVISDLDNDGDQDLVIGHQDEQPAMLRNDCPRGEARAQSYVLRLIGTQSNRQAIGATITLRWRSSTSTTSSKTDRAEAPMVPADPSRTERQNVAEGLEQPRRESTTALPSTPDSANVRRPDSEPSATAGSVIEYQVTEQIKGGGSYLSSHDLRRVFAAPPSDATVEWEIRWPSGLVSKLERLTPNRIQIIIEPPIADATTRVVVGPGSDE